MHFVILSQKRGWSLGREADGLGLVSKILTDQLAPVLACRFRAVALGFESQFSRVCQRWAFPI